MESLMIIYTAVTVIALYKAYTVVAIMGQGDKTFISNSPYIILYFLGKLFLHYTFSIMC